MVAPQLIELIGDTAEVPDQLAHLAEFALKAGGELNMKRRWRTSGVPVRKVVNLSELIKKREQKAAEKAAVELPKIVDEPPKFVPDYFAEDKAEDLKSTAVVSKCKWGKKQ